jgi:hypothetical protein
MVAARRPMVAAPNRAESICHFWTAELSAGGMPASWVSFLELMVVVRRRRRVERGEKLVS